jgi:hypothetical protein
MSAHELQFFGAPSWNTLVTNNLKILIVGFESNIKKGVQPLK